MKYKIIIIIFLSTLFTILIYHLTDKDNLNLLALGDGISTGMTPYNIEAYNYNDYLVEYLKNNKKLEYFYNFNEIEETATTLLTKINNNELNKNKKIKIKQAIKEANIITIALGMEELNNYAKKTTLGTSKINAFLSKYEEILKEIRKLNNNKIFIIGLYSKENLNLNKVSKINEEIKKLANSYNCIFIDITDFKDNEDYFNNNKDFYINYKGEREIFTRIINILEGQVINII